MFIGVTTTNYAFALFTPTILKQLWLDSSTFSGHVNSNLDRRSNMRLGCRVPLGST